ncbi:hypothetical protein JCM5350_000079 [Sporobolomyces pararoseus]
MSVSATTQNPENSEAPFLQSDPSSSLNTSSPDPNPSTGSSSTSASQLPAQNRIESEPTALSSVANEGEQRESSQELDKESDLMKDSAAGPSITGIEQGGCTDTEEAESLARGLAGLTLPESRGESGAKQIPATQLPEAVSQEAKPDLSQASQAALDSDSTTAAVDPHQSPTEAPTLPSRSEPPEAQEEEWLLKSIAWPPLPPRPAESTNTQGFETSELRVKIIQQNRNGPCSLIALCNVLILRNDLHIPPGRDRVTYSYLSTLLADYFLRITSTSSVPPSPAVEQSTTQSSFAPQSSTRQLSLEAALSILPQTQFGLNLNPQFLRVDGFTSSPSSGEGELALFSLAQIPLLHGWIADPSDQETFEVLKEAKDYDRAVEMMVEGSEVAGRLGLEGQGGVDLSEDELLKEAERRSQWTHEEEEKVRKAHLINRFLNTTSTQLTYPGLFALSSTPSLLPPSGLAALFRNSHLSVIYRRPRTPTPHSTPLQSPPGPELFTLVTDSSFAAEEEIVWESIEDVDGSASEFFTAGLSRSHARGGDFAGVRNMRDFPERVRGGGREENEMADLALAQQLQAEEEHRAEAYERAEQQRYEAESQQRNARPHGTETAPRHHQLLQEAGTSTAGGGTGGDGKKSKSKAEKDKCQIM